MGVSWNRGTPNHPFINEFWWFLGYPQVRKPPNNVWNPKWALCLGFSFCPMVQGLCTLDLGLFDSPATGGFSKRLTPHIPNWWPNHREKSCFGIPLDIPISKISQFLVCHRHGIPTPQNMHRMVAPPSEEQRAGHERPKVPVWFSCYGGSSRNPEIYQSNLYQSLISFPMTDPWCWYIC